MGSSPEWFEDERFWEALEPIVFPADKIEAASEEVDHLLSLAGVDDDARVLDIPCGVGRHAVEFASRGFEVTGVDVTEPYLETAGERASEADTDVEFVQADMREFRRPGAFDLVVNVYTSFGYFRDREDDERAARNFYESLRSGGQLVMCLTSKELLAEDFRERSWTESDGVFLLEERELHNAWSWLENRCIVVTEDDRREFTVSHRLYSAHELRDLLRAVGFDDVTVFGNLEGAEFDEAAERLVVVAER